MSETTMMRRHGWRLRRHHVSADGATAEYVCCRCGAQKTESVSRTARGSTHSLTYAAASCPSTPDFCAATTEGGTTR